MTALYIDPSEIKLVDYDAVRKRLMSGQPRPKPEPAKLPLRAPAVVMTAALPVGEAGIPETQAWPTMPLDVVSQYRAILVRSLPDSDCRPRIADIARAVCLRWGVSSTDLLSNRRTAKLVRPRAVAMALSRRLTLNSLPEIGRRLGRRDHTTVLHHFNKLAPAMDRVAARHGDGASLERWVDAMHAELLGGADAKGGAA